MTPVSTALTYIAGEDRVLDMMIQFDTMMADCILTAELLDRARPRGYTMARTGIFAFRPWERILLTKRSAHCGGCRHNCRLSNPGCGVGRDKAARNSG